MASDKDDVLTEISPKMEQTAAQRATDRAKNARWSLEIAVLLFALLIIVIMLATYANAGLEVVGPIAILGLVIVWVMGWMRGKKLYHRFYEEEISELEQESKKTFKAAVKETVEETIEEKVQKALRERLR
jgi:c-di-AMP phosphodiesterase-like protein